MKKLFTLFLAFAASVGTMFAEKVQIGDLYYNLDEDNLTAEVTSQNSSSPYWSTSITSATIPATVTYNAQNYSVTSIGDYAFRSCSGLTSVTIPNSVTSIGNWAFDGCSGLTSIEIPNSVTSIEGSAFRNCSGLTSVTIPNSVTSIGLFAFDGCSGLTSIEIPNSVTSIGEHAFSWCKGLTSIEIPNSVTSIGEATFSECSSLTSVTIPNSVTSIGGSAFYRCKGLTSVTNYALTPQEINSNRFNGVNISSCTLYVPEESVDLYKSAEVWKEFGNIVAIADEPEPCLIASGTCGAEGDNLTWELSCDSVLIISGTGEMDDYENLDDIPWFAYCNLIHDIIFPNGLSYIGERAFAQCSLLKNISLPNSVNKIGDYAFNGSGLETIVIPESVEFIEEHVFHYANSLSSITVAQNNNYFADINGILFDKSKTTLIYCPPALNETEYIVPLSVTQISNGAFYFSNLSKLVLTDNVESVGTQCFSYGKIKEITIGKNIETMGGGFAFMYFMAEEFIPLETLIWNVKACTDDYIVLPLSITNVSFGDEVEIIPAMLYSNEKITRIEIPNSVHTINDNAFKNCSSLDTIYNFASLPQEIDNTVFEGVDKSTCKLFVDGKSLKLYQTADQWKDFANILPIPGTEVDIEEVNINYLNKAGGVINKERVALTLPIAPQIDGFTFLKWEVVQGDLSDGINIQAIYTANTPTSAPAVYTNPKNKAQKLVQNGNVYILTSDKTYTITGQAVK